MDANKSMAAAAAAADAGDTGRAQARDVVVRRDRYRAAEGLPWIIAVAAFFVFPNQMVLGSQTLIMILFALSLDLILGFAGIVTLLNQYVVKEGLQASPGLGNINPTLYRLAISNPSAFNQVTSGNNMAYCQPGTPTGFPSTVVCPAAVSPSTQGVFGYSASNADAKTGYNLVTGLGSPHWDPHARGTIVGLTRGTGRAHLARATLEAIAYQTVDAVRAMEGASGEPFTELRADGGKRDRVGAFGARAVADQRERGGDLRLGDGGRQRVELGIGEVAQIANGRRTVTRQYIERIGEIGAAVLADVGRVGDGITQPVERQPTA